MAESNGSELIWTDDFYTATEAVERSSLPFIVKVAEGFYGEKDYESFSSDDVLKVYARNSLQKVEARVPGSSEPVSIPLAYNGAVKVLPLRDEFFVYRTIGEAMKDEKPTLIRVGKSITLTSRHNVLAGTILKIERIEKRMTPQGVQDFILCVGDHKDLCLPLDCEGDFTVIPDTQCYQLKDVVNQKPLPCKIKIVGGRERLALAKDVQEGISNMEDFSGQFTLMKTFMQEVLVCSTRIHEAGCPKESLVSKKNIIIIPLSPVPLDVSFFIAEDSPDYQKIIVKSFGTEIDISQVQDDDAYIEYMTNPRSRVFCGSTGSAPKVPPHTFRGDSNTSDRNGSAEVSGNVLDCASDSEGDGYEEINDEDLDELKQGRARREALKALFKGEEDQHGYLIPQQGEQIESKECKTSPDRGKQTKKPVIRPNIKKAIGTVREIGKNIVSTFHKHQQHQNTEIAKTEQDVPPERPPKRPPKPASLKKANPRKGKEPFRPPLDEDELANEQLGQIYEEPEEPTPTVTPRTPKSPSDISSDFHPSSPETKELWFPTGLKKQKESPTVNPVQGGDENDCNPKHDEEMAITESSKSNDGARTEPNSKIKTSNLSRSKSEKQKPPVLPKPRTQRKFSDSSLLRDKGEEALTVTSSELKMVPTASVMPSRHIRVEPTVPVARPRHDQNQKEENTLLETTAEHLEQQENHHTMSRVQSPDPRSTNGTLSAESQSTLRAQLRQRKPAQPPQPETLSEIRKSLTHVSSKNSDPGALSINSFDDVPSDLSTLSVTDLESVLQLYGLHNAAKICRVNEVDGALFMLLTDTILKEDPFNLKPFDILKIQNIKKGWKPKQSTQSIKS